MAENIDTIIEMVKQYAGLIQKENIRIDKLYLFGSYARGVATDESDIDVVIISKDFKGDRFDDRRKLVPLRRKLDRRIEPIPYRPEDFKKNDPLVVEILSNSVEVI